MDSSISSTTLKSDGVAKVLTVILFLGLCLSIFSLFLSIILVTVPSFYAVLKEIDMTLLGFILIPFTIVVFLLWMYRLHHDLREIFKEYPITSGGALARLIIPFYNLWGVWNTFSVLDHYLRKEARVSSLDRKSTRLNSSHTDISRMPSSA